MPVVRIFQRASLLTALLVWPIIRLITAFRTRSIRSDGQPQRFPCNVPAGFEAVDNVRLSSYDLSAHAEHFSEWNVCCVISEQTKQLNRTIIYLHGGAFINGIQSAHWKLCAVLAKELDARVLLVPYPLLPATMHAILEPLLQLYSIIHEDAKSQGHEIILAGDRCVPCLVSGLLEQR